MLSKSLATILALSSLQAVKAQLFTVSCAPLSIERSDPIVSPGVVGGHVHNIVGGTNFQRTMDSTIATLSADTTCDKIEDNSNYWQPTLYHINSDGEYEYVTFQGGAVYYLNRACNYEPGRTNCASDSVSVAPPAGLRMLAGNPFLRTFDESSAEQQAMNHVCLTDGEDVPQTHGFPNHACLRMRSEVFFPSCWDGVNLDSPNHKSHVAYPAYGSFQGGVCPESHPVAIYSVFLEWFYDTSPFQDSFDKFIYAMNDTTGYGLHGDYLQGWSNQTALEEAINTCVAPNSPQSPGCSINKEHPAVQLIPAHPLPAPLEEVGLNGPLKCLPGFCPQDSSTVESISPVTEPVSPVSSVIPASPASSSDTSVSSALETTPATDGCSAASIVTVTVTATSTATVTATVSSTPTLVTVRRHH